MYTQLSVHQIRGLTVAHQLYKNYYDALGVSSKATQADIKAAYYKLSMLYHPDRNQGCKESAAKFQRVKAAYEVLSDYGQRRLYDRGLLAEAGEGLDMGLGAFRSPGTGSVVQKTRPVTTGRSPVYNYDEWSRAHYGESLARKTSAREEMAAMRREKEMEERLNNNQRVGMVLGALALSIIVFNITFNNNDEPTVSRSRNS